MIKWRRSFPSLFGEDPATSFFFREFGEVVCLIFDLLVYFKKNVAVYVLQLHLTLQAIGNS